MNPDDSIAETYALIVGGGTAGHVLPGVAIGRELVARGHDPGSIHFVGSERGVDKTLVPEAGFTLTVLPGRGIQRRMTTDNIGAVTGLVRAFRAAGALVGNRRPKVVVVLGGYASVPAGMWAVLRRIPIVVAEQNAVPGLANRIMGRFARACAISYVGTDLPNAVWTGNPVRSEILSVRSSTSEALSFARARLEVGRDRRLVVIFGGSLGARTINEAVVEALPLLADRADLSIRHIVGSRDYEQVVERAPVASDGQLEYRPIEYEDDMASVYAAAELIVCRSGATSCAELAATGTPSVLIPLPGAPSDHQTANARALEEAGGAELIPDSMFDGQQLVATIDRLLGDSEHLDAMSKGALSIARPDAARAVADLVEQYGGL